MSTNQEWLQRRANAIPSGVAHATTIVADKAKNSVVWDVEGNRYIDFAGGIAVMNVGHAHPKVMQAAAEQGEKFSHVAFQVMAYTPYIELAEKLNELAPGPTPKKTILFSTGAEAVENAVKIARAKTGRPGVISFVGGFHGRTLLTLALTGKVDPYKKGFGPLPNNVYHVPFPIEHHGISVEDTLHEIKELFKADVEPTQIAAIILEPVQGEGGFYAAPPELMRELRKLCDEHGILLIADEVQSGVARTGKLFAMEHYDVEADLITVAKSIAAGYPLSAVIGKADIMDAPKPGGLGGTYGGNPVACAVGLAVLDLIEEENLLEKSENIGDRFSVFLNNLKSNGMSVIGDVRNVGAMAAFEIVDADGNPDPVKTKELTKIALSLGLVILSCGVYGNTIRILVPLTVENDVLEEGLVLLEKALSQLA